MEKEKKEVPKANKRSATSYYDISLIFIVVCLACFGLMMVYSTTSYSDYNTYNDEWNTTKKQAIYLGIIMPVVIFFISKWDYHLYAKLSPLLYVIDLVLLVLVKFLGKTANGSARWITLGPINIQPSEFAKPILILLIAQFYYANYDGLMAGARRKIVNITNKASKGEKKKKITYEPDRITGKILLLCLLIIGVVTIENLSTGIILFLIMFAMFFIANRRKKIFVILTLAGISFIGIVIYLVQNEITFFGLQEYQLSRILAWLNPTEYKEESGYQILQGLYAVGSGGLTGKGLGSSIQKLGYLPEAQNDMVFGIICEELGLLGAGLVLALFVLLLMRILMIAFNAPDFLGFMICSGVFIHFALQVCMNVAVVTNSMPNTGVGLPFISSGGSAFLVCVGEIAMVLSVSRRIKTEK